MIHDSNMMNKSNGKFLTISCWKINGLAFKANGEKSNKLHDKEVINELNKLDLIG